MKKIGLIVAMESELSPILRQFGDLEVLSEKPYAVKKLAVGERELYIAQSGVGEIYAAGAAQYLLTAYGCEELWNFGVVGGLTDEMDYNRTVAVRRVVHYAFDTSAIDGVPVGFYAHRKDLYFYADEGLLSSAQAAIPDLSAVTIASADKFVADPAEKEALAKNFGADICDMESAAIALTAENNGVPFLMIKAVSDSKNDGAKFNALVTEACEKFGKVVGSLLKGI